MRVRALDVLAARVGGQPLAFQGCTLAAASQPDGARAREASGWLGPDTAPPAVRDGVSGVVEVALETDEGLCAGLAVVSLFSEDATARSRVQLVGVGGLDPWPG